MTNSTSIGQLEQALDAIQAFADRAQDPDDVLVYSRGVAVQYCLLVDHNLSGCVGSKVRLECRDGEDFRYIAVTATLGGTVVDHDFSESLVG